MTSVRSSSAFLTLRADRAGVSGVVAASLGVVLLSVLLGMIVTFWVPAWGYDNEAAHSREVVDAFAQFKSGIELQTLSGNTNQTIGTSFPLGVGGVPLFGAENSGQLAYQYLEGGHLRFALNLTESTGQANLSAAGSLSYSMPNRYFVGQSIAYESGAVIVSQTDGQTVRMAPAFRFVNGTQGIEAFLTLVSMEGVQTIVTGVDSHSISSRLALAQTIVYTFPAGSNLSLNVSSAYIAAWSSYFVHAMNASSVNASMFNVSFFPPSAPQSTTLMVVGVRALTVTISLVQVRVD